MQVLLKIIKSCEAHGNDIKNNKSNAICKNKLSWWVPSFLTLLFVEKQTKIVGQRNQTPFLVTPLSFACLHGRLWPLIILIPVPISNVALKSQAGILQTVHVNVSCPWVLRHHFTLSCTWTKWYLCLILFKCIFTGNSICWNKLLSLILDINFN